MSWLMLSSHSPVANGKAKYTQIGVSLDASSSIYLRKGRPLKIWSSSRLEKRTRSSGLFQSQGYQPYRLKAPIQCTLDREMNNLYTKCPPMARSIESGMLQVRPLENEDVSDAVSLLTRMFLNSPDSISPQKASAVDRSFCENALLAPPKAIMFVAILTPNDPCELGPGRKTRLIGLTYLSLSPDTRPTFPNAQPPYVSAYLSSMAVDSKYRRQGVATMLIKTCEELCNALNITQLSLHAWSNETIPQKCYSACNFVYAEKQKSVLPPMWKSTRTRLLMLKQLAP